MMAADRRRMTSMTPAELGSAGMLAGSVGGLAAGGGLYLAGARGAADATWLAVTALGLGYALLTLIDSLRRRRAGVDVIALLALAGALAVGELVAGAVITVMLASGQIGRA